MKISEIRNNLFRLSDLKGLIHENTFDEDSIIPSGRGRAGKSWASFFSENPERLKLSFLKALGLNHNPAGPFTDEEKELIKNSEIGRYFKFTDSDVEEINANLERVFNTNNGIANNYSTAKKNVAKRFRNSESGLDVLKNFFERGSSTIPNPSVLESGDMSAIRNYFQQISELAYEAIKYSQENNIKFGDIRNITSDTIGDVYNPYSMFLYFVFYCAISTNGLHNGNVMKDNIPVQFKKIVDKEEVRLNSLLSGKEFNLVDTEERENPKLANMDFIQFFILNKIGLKHGELLTADRIQVLYNSYFASEDCFQNLMSGIQEIKAAKPNTTFPLSNETFSFNTVGGLTYAAISLLMTNNRNFKNIIDAVMTYMPGSEVSEIRNAVCRMIYEERSWIIFDETFLNTVSETFGIPYASLFDPAYEVNNKVVIEGLKRFVLKNGGNEDGLRPLVRTSLCYGLETVPPIEKIFSLAKTLDELLKTDFYKRLGASGRNILNSPDLSVLDKISLLVGKASDGLKLLNEDAVKRGYAGTNLPAGIDRLNTLYKGVSGTKKRETMFWEILKRDSGTKTQDDIFYFLFGISDKDIEWQSEYNRYEGVEKENGQGGLGRKSIDIMGKKYQNAEVNGKPVKTNKVVKRLCFEYQGEQHYRPINIVPADYDYSLYSEMREEVLMRCGFTSGKGKEGGKRNYYWATKDIPTDELPLDMRQIIIDVFKEQFEHLVAAVQGGRFSMDKVVTEGTGVHRGIKRNALTSFKYGDAINYFREVINRGANDLSMFVAPPINGAIPYLCSPCRFADEIFTAIDLQRDRMKSDIIFNRRKLGWEMAYITPKVSASFTEEDLMYTVSELAKNNPEAVFQWDKEGKTKLTAYLVNNGFKTQEQELVAENTLFRQIFNEIKNEYNY